MTLDPTAPPATLMSRTLLDEHYVAAYEELRRLASRVGRRDAHYTLSATALVNEAWLKLAKAPDFVSTSEVHFKHIAARAMRQVLVEAARRRLARKRNGGEIMVSLDLDAHAPQHVVAADVLALNDALERLVLLSRRQADVVEARFFSGLTTAEIATLLGVSEVTVMRDWRVAKAWLNAELRRG